MRGTVTRTPTGGGRGSVGSPRSVRPRRSVGNGCRPPAPARRQAAATRRRRTARDPVYRTGWSRTPRPPSPCAPRPYPTRGAPIAAPIPTLGLMAARWRPSLASNHVVTRAAKEENMVRMTLRHRPGDGPRPGSGAPAGGRAPATPSPRPSKKGHGGPRRRRHLTVLLASVGAAGAFTLARLRAGRSWFRLGSR